MATTLPEEVQNDIAKQLMEDIEGEFQWDNTLARSQDQLAKLANQALEEFKAGRTKKMGFDELWSLLLLMILLIVFINYPKTSSEQQKNYKLWKQNLNHPGLDFKRVHNTKPIYSVRIGIGWRALGMMEDDNLIWFWIGAHQEYDRLLKQL